MAVQLTDGSNNNVVDATSKGILVQNPKVASQAGYAGVVAIRDSGSITGTPNIGQLDINNHKGLRVSVDTPLFQDQFNYTAQNTTSWSYISSTMTTTWGSGAMTLNGGSSVTSGNYTLDRTYRSFPLYTAGELVWSVHGFYTQSPQLNNAHWMGIGIPGTTTAPSDGCYFELDATGSMRGVVSWSGNRNTTSVFSAPSSYTQHLWSIVIDDSLVEFWIDGVLYGSVIIPTGVGTPTANGAGYAFFQMYNSGTVATAQQFKVYNIQITLYGLNTSKPWPHIKIGEGLGAYQGQNGGTLGTTALYANSGLPTAAVPTNTTAALGSGLGGNFYETATVAINTDAIISSYQNPVGTVNQTARNLYITGFRWNSIVQTVLAGGPFVYECGIAFGHTAVSLANAESSSSKAPRRFPVGLHTFAATAVGTLGANFVHTFTTPLLVQPGEFIQTIVRNIGTVGTSGTIAHMIAFEGYWE